MRFYHVCNIYSIAGSRNTHSLNLVTPAPPTSATETSGFNSKPRPTAGSTSTADKIEFLKTASEKSKTQTILQKRTDNNSLTTQTAAAEDDSDDEIRIVDIIKNDDYPKGASSNRSIEDMVETVMSNQAQMSNQMISALPSSSKIVINNKFINYISSPEPASSAPPRPSVMASHAGTSIKINPKYAKLLANKIPGPGPQSPVPQMETEAEQRNATPPQQQQQQQQQQQEEDGGRKTIRLNPQLTSMIGGKTAQECDNIADSGEPPEKLPRPSPALITINPKYAG